MDGLELEGERGSLLHLSEVDVEDRGCYRCSVKNSLGVIMSPPAVLTIQSMYIVWIIGAFSCVIIHQLTNMYVQLHT